MIVGAKFGYATLNRRSYELKYVKTIWDDRDGPGKADR